MHTNITTTTSSSSINSSIGWSTKLPDKIYDQVTWVMLVPFGLYTHPLGVQRMTIGSSNEIVQYFYSLRGRVNRKFRGLPIYFGHPAHDDYPERNPEGYQVDYIYGHILDLQTRDDGLWGRIRWTKEGLALGEKNCSRCISPHWILRSVHTDVFEPCKLLSLGMSYVPNYLNAKNSKYTQHAPLEITDFIPAKSLTEDLAVASKKTSLTKEQLLFRVYEHMRKSGDSYLSSWKKITQLYPEYATIYLSDKNK